MLAGHTDIRSKKKQVIHICRVTRIKQTRELEVVLLYFNLKVFEIHKVWSLTKQFFICGYIYCTVRMNMIPVAAENKGVVCYLQALCFPNEKTYIHVDKEINHNSYLIFMWPVRYIRGFVPRNMWSQFRDQGSTHNISSFSTVYLQNPKYFIW